MSVYFATSGRYVKIGYSRNPLARVSTITRLGARPDDIPFAAEADLIGWIPGDAKAEKTWHARFAAGRVAGEWFALDPDVAREVIWADPCGIDVERMPALTVFTAVKHPGISRQQLVDSGISIECRSLEDAMRGLFGGPTEAGAA